MQPFSLPSFATAFEAFNIALGLFSFSASSHSPSPSCTNPSVRKEWRKLSTGERAEWIAAVNCLSKLPHDPRLTAKLPLSQSGIVPINASGSYYDDFVYMHMDLNMLVHNTGLFYPWHRWYNAVYETAMKERCGYTGASPYWNWTIDAANFFESEFWQDADPSSGMGGWGDPDNDFQVPDGGFSTFALSYPTPHILRRNFTMRPLTPFLGNDLVGNPYVVGNTTFTNEIVAEGINGYVGDFSHFQQWMERLEGPHAPLHLIMGGDLGGDCPSNAPADCQGGPTFSSNEPLFWLHHAMVDKVWYDWQHANPANFWAYLGGSVQSTTNMTYYNQFPSGAPPMLSLDSTLWADGLFPEVTVGDVMNTTGGFLCYVYE